MFFHYFRGVIEGEICTPKIRNFGVQPECKTTFLGRLHPNPSSMLGNRLICCSFQEDSVSDGFETVLRPWIALPRFGVHRELHSENTECTKLGVRKKKIGFPVSWYPSASYPKFSALGSVLSSSYACHCFFRFLDSPNLIQIILSAFQHFSIVRPTTFKKLWFLDSMNKEHCRMVEQSTRTTHTKTRTRLKTNLASRKTRVLELKHW